jgi:hypothetical protein
VLRRHASAAIHMTQFQDSMTILRAADAARPGADEVTAPGRRTVSLA